MNSVWQKRSNAARLRVYSKVGAWDDASHIYEKIIRPGDDALKDVAPPLLGVLEALPSTKRVFTRSKQRP